MRLTLVTALLASLAFGQSPDRPAVFRSEPGIRVVIDSVQLVLDSAHTIPLITNAKDGLHDFPDSAFSGFYLQDAMTIASELPDSVKSFLELRCPPHEPFALLRPVLRGLGNGGIRFGRFLSSHFSAGPLRFKPLLLNIDDLTKPVKQDPKKLDLAIEIAKDSVIVRRFPARRKRDYYLGDVLLRFKTSEDSLTPVQFALLRKVLAPLHATVNRSLRVEGSVVALMPHPIAQVGKIVQVAGWLEKEIAPTQPNPGFQVFIKGIWVP